MIRERSKGPYKLLECTRNSGQWTATRKKPNTWLRGQTHNHLYVTYNDREFYIVSMF